VSDERQTQSLDLQAAADVVALSPATLQALVGAGYLAAVGSSDGPPRFELAELKAFVARNADNGAGGSLIRSLSPALEPQELVALLDERAEHMAIRLFKMYTTVFPQANGWPADRVSRFVRVTKERFEAILAIAALGDRFEADMIEDLERIGASAARAGVRLPQVLTMLRVSRDLVVQNAIDLVDRDDRQGGQALSLVLTRILPAMDQLGDALTAGYWEAMFPV
jgi:hypothetical protein